MCDNEFYLFNLFYRITESTGWEWESDGCQFSAHHRDNHTHSAVDSGVCERITSVYKDTPRGSDYVTQGKYETFTIYKSNT